jgi:hypothetical protein
MQADSRGACDLARQRCVLRVNGESAAAAFAPHLAAAFPASQRCLRPR